MKPFDLEQALAGKPCVTRDGYKATIIAAYPVPVETNLPVTGYVEKDGRLLKDSWTFEGRATYRMNIEHPCDLVGMWEEPAEELTEGSFKYMHKFVKLRSGDKAYITGLYPNDEYPYAGLIFRNDEEITMSFNSAGEAYKRWDLSIVGLWEESI